MFRTALFLAALLLFTVSAQATEPLKLEQTLSLEKIFETKFEGQATVDFQVGQVTALNIDSRAVPDASQAHVIQARMPQGKDDQQFFVILPREIVARLVQLGIDDLPKHVQDKWLRVKGRVECLEDNRFRIAIANLDQWLSIRTPAAASDTSTRQAELPRTRAELDWLAATIRSATATHASTSEESQESRASIERILCGKWKGGPCMGTLNFAADGTFEREHYTPGDNQIGGTWRMRWDALPPTLVLTYKTSDDTDSFPVGKTLELKVLQLSAQTLSYAYPGDHSADYDRVAPTDQDD